jgi:hypothetical protein
VVISVGFAVVHVEVLFTTTELAGVMISSGAEPSPGEILGAWPFSHLAFLVESDYIVVLIEPVDNLFGSVDESDIVVVNPPCCDLLEEFNGWSVRLVLP